MLTSCCSWPKPCQLAASAGLHSSSMAGLAATTTCQMRQSPTSLPSSSGAMPHGLPLTKPLGLARGGQTAKLQLPVFFAATNQLDAAAPGFVRPDVPPDSDDEAPPLWSVKSARPSTSGNSTINGTSENKANFRSALEQASWMSAEEQAGRADRERSGLFGLGTHYVMAQWRVAQKPRRTTTPIPCSMATCVQLPKPAVAAQGFWACKACDKPDFRNTCNSN